MWLISTPVLPGIFGETAKAEKAAGKKVTWSRSAPNEPRTLNWMFAIHEEAVMVLGRLKLDGYKYTTIAEMTGEGNAQVQGDDRQAGPAKGTARAPVHQSANGVRRGRKPRASNHRAAPDVPGDRDPA